MQLRDVGETCILELEHVASRIYRELKRYNAKINNQDRAKINEVVTELFDDHLTRNMYWTKRSSSVYEGVYIDKLGWLVDKYPSPRMLIQDADDMIAQVLDDIVELPTWHILSVRKQDSMVTVSMGEDFRLGDWMEKHGAEYGFKKDTKLW